MKSDSACVSFHFANILVTYADIQYNVGCVSVGTASTTESTGRPSHDGETARGKITREGTRTVEEGAGSE